MPDADNKVIDLVLLNSTADVIHSWSIETSEPGWESEVQFVHIPLIEAIREYMNRVSETNLPCGDNDIPG